MASYSLTWPEMKEAWSAAHERTWSN